MSHILVVDVGNSRMKWALVSKLGYVAQGIVPIAEIGTLSLRDWQNLHETGACARRERRRRSCARARRRPARALARCNGMAGRDRVRVRRHQSLREPLAELGADRWASCIAARLRANAADETLEPIIVVNAGTAVTIDSVDADGVFRGGMILPNMRLMLRSPPESTSALKVPPGGFQEFPTNNADALYTGALHAVCGAIELARARVSTQGIALRCYLAGGAASEIGQHLAAPVELIITSRSRACWRWLRQADDESPRYDLPRPRGNVALIWNSPSRTRLS